jgi:hypothetical protein
VGRKTNQSNAEVNEYRALQAQGLLSPFSRQLQPHGEIMNELLAIVMAVLSGINQVNRAKAKQPAASNPMAELLAQQQAAEAANCQLLMDMMAQQQAQQVAMLQQMMAPSPFNWW